jgi:hypothetical protein
MKDKNKILAGLVVFIALFTLPFWFNMGKAAPAPELELTEKAKAAKVCVMPTEYMKAEHMQLLDVWRTMWSETRSGRSSTPKASFLI